MSRKITVGAALALALLLVAASIPLTMIYAQRQQNKLIPELPKKLEEFGALDEIQNKVNDHFYAKPAGDAVNAAMVRGYIAGLGDSSSRYLSAQEYQTYMDRLEGKAPELGLVMRYSPEEAGLVIDQVKAGSTAAVSGLKPGDQIVKVESGGKALFNMPEVLAKDSTDALAKFGEATSVSVETSSNAFTITYKRKGTYQPPANVMLGSAVSNISSDMMEAWAKQGETPLKTVGYIKIFHFFKNTAAQIEDAVKELSRQGAVSYIIDVRGCSEGNLEYACEAIDLFAYVTQDARAMASVRYRDGTSAPKPATANNIMSYTTGGQVVVLINEHTSGVAELFAYDLHAYNATKVFLVGEHTKGVNTVQEPFSLASVGGAALLTVGTVTPYGGDAAWNENGVQPNDPIPGTEKLDGVTYRISEPELQLSGAIDILTKPREKDAQ